MPREARVFAQSVWGGVYPHVACASFGRRTSMTFRIKPEIDRSTSLANRARQRNSSRRRASYGTNALSSKRMWLRRSRASAAIPGGLPVEAVAEIEYVLRKHAPQKALVVDVRPSQVHVKVFSGNLTRVSANRELISKRTSVLRKLAIEVLGDRARAESWLTTKFAPLGGHTPLQCATSARRTEEARQFLMRIAHGVFS